MNVACPTCSTVYRIDPARVPVGGVGTACRECGTAFRVEAGGPSSPGAVATGPVLEAGRAEAAGPAGEAGPAASGGGGAAAGAAPAPPAPQVQGASGPAFGPQDPGTRARRLARALVSDIKVYNPEKWEESRTEGTLRTEFREEILKSWEEYLEQVGDEMAKKTPYFRDALNDILAGGARVF